MVQVGQWIGGSGQINSSSFSFRIEGGCVSGNAWRTHPSRPAGSGPALSSADHPSSVTV